MTTITYTGGGNASSWTDGANWTGGTAPGPTDTALIGTGPDVTITTAATANNLMLLGSRTTTFDGPVTTYGLGGDCKGMMVCAGATASFAPGSSLSDGGVLQVGVRSAGTLVATGTGTQATTLSAERTELGKLAAASGAMTLDGASLTDRAGLTVGEAGQGTLLVTDGGRVSARDLVIGLAAGATGTVSMSNGATISVGRAFVGTGKGGVGTLLVGAASLLHTDETLHVAASGTLGLAGGTLAVDQSQGWSSVAAGGSVTGYGLVTTRAGAGLDVGGTITASGGTLDLQTRLSGTGTLAIAGGSTAQVDGSSVGLSHIAFTGPASTLVLAQAATVLSEIDGFTAADRIEMAGITGVSWNQATNLLTLSSAGTTVDRLHLAGSFDATQFGVSQQNGVGIISLHG